jgi:3-oxoadipate enol-lactonase
MAAKHVKVDGITFCALYEGNSEDQLVVLSHALMSNLHMWDSTVVALHKAGFSTLRYDHVGHGQTSTVVDNKVDAYHFDAFTHHIHELSIRIHGWPPFAIIGCSMGGVLALRYALLYPGVLKKAVSCDAPGMTSLEVSKKKWTDRLAVFREQGVEVLAKATVERWFPDPCPQEVKDEALKHTLSCTLNGYAACAHGITTYDYYAELGNIKTEQVMVLVGENDEAVGPKEILQDVAAKVPGAKYVTMKDTGHIPPMHSAAAFESIVVDFLKPPT